MFNVTEQLVPLDIKEFESITEMPSDCLFYGTILKSNFDLKKASINSNFDTKKLFVVLKVKKGFSIVYLYGTFLKVKPEYRELLSNLNLFSQIPTSKHTLKNYLKILKVFNLSCEDSYLYFNKDIYPIDSTSCSMLFNNFSQSNFFNPNTAYPFYLTITAPYIFYFTNLKNNLLTLNNFLNKNASLAIN